MVNMFLKQYNDDQLSFWAQELKTPGSLTYQLVVQYDDNWIFEGYFDSEDEVKTFVKTNYQLFEERAEYIQYKLAAQKQALSQEVKNELEWALLYKNVSYYGDKN